MATHQNDVRVVLDASALLAWIFQERGHATIDRILPYSLISTVNFAEVIRRNHERGYQRSPEELANALLALGLAIEPTLTASDAIRATQLVYRSWQEKTKHQDRLLSMCDALCIAVAERHNLPAVSSDQLWEELHHLFQVKILPLR